MFELLQAIATELCDHIDYLAGARARLFDADPVVETFQMVLHSKIYHHRVVPVHHITDKAFGAVAVV